MAAAEETSITPGSITRAAATQKFFAIVELVEQVLLYKSVTMENLFVLQRINKTVQGIIRGSQLLQRKMHLALETKFDGTAPTQYNTIFSIPPGYIGRFPYHSITNKRISNAFGNFAIVLLPGTDGGLMMVRACPFGSSNSCRLGSDLVLGTWKDMLIANVPLTAVHHTHGKGLPFLKAGIKQSDNVRTLGDLHQAIGSLGHRLDCLELYSAARCPVGGHTAAARIRWGGSGVW